jgi:uncharacterized cupredoxin-like copper-binding protein
MPRRILVPVVLFLALALSGCGTASQPATQVTVLETDFAYHPFTITVPVNQSITLVFENTGLVEHDFVIEQVSLTEVVKSDSESHGMSGHDMGDTTHYDLHVSTLPGQSSSIEFTPTEAGTYEFFCTVEGHREAGMTGKMVVINQ